MPDLTRWTPDSTRWTPDLTRWTPDSTRWTPDLTRWTPDLTRWMSNLKRSATKWKLDLRPFTPTWRMVYVGWSVRLMCSTRTFWSCRQISATSTVAWKRSNRNPRDIFVRVNFG